MLTLTISEDILCREKCEAMIAGLGGVTRAVLTTPGVTRTDGGQPEVTRRGEVGVAVPGRGQTGKPFR